jgi:hypothetical protein
MSLKAVLAFCATVAAGGTGLASPSDSPSPEEANPCKTISSACKAEGYTKQGKEKNLQKDCMQRILSGQTVQGVQVDATDVQACEARRREQENPR